MATKGGGLDRIRAFAKFFKGYMGIAALVTAALPIPVTMWKLIPVFESLSGVLKVYTPLVCFLIFAFVFSSRHWIGRVIFQRSWTATKQDTDPGLGPAILAFLPLGLIVAAVASIVAYQAALDESVGTLLEQTPEVASEATLLAKTERYAVPNGPKLTTLYMLIFVFSELAFVLMALREHLQDVLGLTDEQLLRRVQPAKSKKP